MGRRVGEEADLILGPDSGRDARGLAVVTVLVVPVRMVDGGEGVQREGTVLVGGRLGWFWVEF